MFETLMNVLLIALGIVVIFLRRMSALIRYPIVIGLFLCVLLPSCSLYHHKYDVPSNPSNAAYDFHVIQSDDFGSLWDIGAAQKALDDVAASAGSKNLIVVVFIHGWHHNADPDGDENLADFRKSLDAMAKELSQAPYQRARSTLTGSPDFRLVGIYVGWRGRSLPGFLDYATMWWRKSAAERVGSGDVAEFLTRLQLLYDKTNAFDPDVDTDPRKVFMGLVTIGHSFGGQVLLKSVAPRLEERLIAVTPRLADTLPKAEAIEREMQAPVAGFGDLNVLLNPALEAYQLARIDALYRERTYPRLQTPQLVVFSADDDWARQTFFPIARALTAPFRPAFRDAHQASLWGRALGELEDQRTHKLTLSNEPDTLTVDLYDQDHGLKIVDHDFTGHTVFSGVALDPDTSKPRIVNSPVEVIYTYQDIITQHSGIFQDQFRTFLVNYAAFIEGKRLAARYLDMQNKIEKKMQERQRVRGE